MKIGFLGDSITLGYGLENREGDRFTGLICSKLSFDEVNLGITGTLVARAGLSRQDGTAFVDRAGQLKGVDFAVVFGGTNDYFWTDCDLTGSETEYDVQYFDHAVSAILRELKSFLPDNRILFVTPYPHHGIGNRKGGAHFRDESEHDTTYPNFVGRTLLEYSEAAVKICETAGVQVLDLHHVPDSFDWKTMTSDGCHPNPEGHRWLAKQIGEKMSQMLNT